MGKIPESIAEISAVLNTVRQPEGKLTAGGFIPVGRVEPGLSIRFYPELSYRQRIVDTEEQSPVTSSTIQPALAVEVSQRTDKGLETTVVPIPYAADIKGLGEYRAKLVQGYILELRAQGKL